MTEAEWHSASIPGVLLRHLASSPHLAGERKLRLFGVACLRRLLPLLTHPASHTALDVLERFADGAASHDEAVRATRELTQHHAADPATTSVATFLGDAISRLCSFPLRLRELNIALATASSLAFFVHRRRTDLVEAATQVRLLRDLVPNPFRPQRLDPAWLTWERGLVPALARAIYHDRAFDRLPILADALEDAGCDDSDLLDHLRATTEHARGCWAVDRVLNLE